MKKLIKQPNGKYCETNIHGDLLFFNYTEEDVISHYIESAKEDMNNSQHYGELVQRLVYAQKAIPHEQLKSMGFEKSYIELMRSIPLRPLRQIYVSFDFATYGHCPNCNSIVQDGIGHRDDKCECGQLLKW